VRDPEGRDAVALVPSGGGSLIDASCRRLRLIGGMLGRRAISARINVHWLTFSVLSGCVWGIVASVLGYPLFGRISWAAAAASPAIGAAVGFAVAKLHRASSRAQVLVSLLTLYASAALIAMVIAMFGLVASDPSWHRGKALGVLPSLAAVLVGLTGTGYVFILWPLAFLNHVMLWRRYARQVDYKAHIPSSSVLLLHSQAPPLRPAEETTSREQEDGPGFGDRRN
jgi:hypothetical protein